MSKIVEIRNNSSTKPIKPRVFDMLVEDGVVFLEIKNGKRIERILLTDVLYQVIAGLTMEYTPSPEPQC